ncbi:MAG: HIT domain-containing protein [Opitutales bacterium]
MDHLHAYWRMEYIEAPRPADVSKGVFRQLPGLSDEEALIIWRGEHTYLVLNKFPYNAGHLLAVPYREVAELEGLEAHERAELMEALVIGQRVLSQAIRPDGFNVGFNFGSAAGAGIPRHLHGHIVPRWNGDTNFMPVLGQTRVLPQSLEAMWERLKSFT